MNINLSSRVKAQAHALGFDLVGICPAVPAPHLDSYDAWLSREFHASMNYLLSHRSMKEHPAHLLPGVRSIVAVGLNYYQANEVASGQPKIARYALGRDYHKVIRGKLRSMARTLEDEGAETRICVDSAPIFERDFARLAGLGWFGKNTLLINSQRGSWFLIGLLLTTAVLDYDQPAEGGCGSCRQCIEACPTGAIVFEDGRWQVDARRCISYLTIEHKGSVDAFFDWTFGCDVCQEVCPFNAQRASQPLRAQVTQEPDFLDRKPFPSLVDLAQIAEDQWDEITKGSPVRRAGVDGLRRNALINLRTLDADRDASAG